MGETDAPGFVSPPKIQPDVPGIPFHLSSNLSSMLLMFPSFSIACLSGLFLLSLFRPTSKTAALLGWYFLVFAGIVVTEEAAHFLNVLNKPGWILLIQGTILAVTLTVWGLRGRPPLGGGLFIRTGLISRTTIGQAIRRHPVLVFFASATGLGYVYSFFLGWMIAPNTFDAITTHAVRVVYWLQHGNLAPWNAFRYTQVSYPLNAQLQLLWSAQFLHSDQLFFTVQWLGALVAILAVFGLARLLQYSRWQAMFASLVFACFPLIWMQSSTAQNDLVAAAVFLAVFYFFFLGITQRQPAMLTLSGIALGLSLGTKQTLFFYLPGLALLAGIVWLTYRKSVTRLLTGWVVASLAGFLVLGSFIYVQNYVYFGNPLAPQELVETVVGGKEPEAALGNITYNSLRLLYQSVDNSGLPEPAGDFLTRVKNKTIGAVLRAINPNLESGQYSAASHTFGYRKLNVLGEDSSWFGPIGGLFLVPLGAIQLWQAVRKKNPWRGGLVLTVILYWLMDAWLRPGWDPYQGRYFIPAAGLLAPFLASLRQKGWVSRVTGGIIAAASIFVLGYTAIFNPGKSPIPQLDDAWSVKANFAMIFKLDWVEQVTLQSRGSLAMAKMVDENVPPKVTLGWLGFSAPEYTLFGEHFERKIIPINPPALIHDPGWLAQQGIDTLLMDWDKRDGPAPVGFKEQTSVFNWLLLERK